MTDLPIPSLQQSLSTTEASVQSTSLNEQFLVSAMHMCGMGLYVSHGKVHVTGHSLQIIHSFGKHF